MKRILIALSMMISLLTTGCAAANAETKTEKAETAVVQKENVETMKDYTCTPDNVKLLGRTHMLDDMLMLAYSGTGVEFTLKGTKAEVTIAGDTAATTANNDANYARFAVYVNGERKIDEQVKALEKTYTVFESETEQEVDIKIIKLSETAMSTIGIKKISAVSADGIKPAPEKDLKIEIIGDSITCGYGVDDEDKEHHFSTATEDVTKSYSYKTAEALNADYSMVSISGYGVISGYSGDGVKHPEQALPQYYTKMGFAYSTLSGKKPSDIDWDFTKFTPDVVVINLGTNDDSYCGTDSAKQEEYAAAYVEFLKTVREKNPDAKIICTLGIMGARLYPYVEYAAYNYTQETGDTNISCMQFEQQTEANGYAADWHPTAKTHDIAAEKLTAEIKKQMNIK